MAKLVEILAKELGEWPEDSCLTICQDTSGDIGAWRTLSPAVTCPDDDDVVWSSMGHITNITPLSCIADDHATAIVTREMWQAERDKLKPSADAKAVYGGPVRWRDRILEIDAQTKAMATEREFLVSKLAGEGFALIVQAAETEELPRKEWEIGDLVMLKCESPKTDMPAGKLLPITRFDGSSCGQDVEVDGFYFPPVSGLVWHSRPDA